MAKEPDVIKNPTHNSLPYPLPSLGISMRFQGRITTWQDDKGFGFITPDGEGVHVFVHISSFSNQRRRPTENEIVTYELKFDGKGRAQAATVVFVGERATPDSSRSHGNISLLFAGCFILLVATAVFTGKLPEAVLLTYLVASIVAFIAYAFDKSASLNNRWRIQESTLHLFALLGGWPGALIAQRLLHHKSRKKSFQIEFWATVFFNCGTLGWLFSSYNAITLR